MKNLIARIRSALSTPGMIKAINWIIPQLEIIINSKITSMALKLVALALIVSLSTLVVPISPPLEKHPSTTDTIVTPDLSKQKPPTFSFVKTNWEVSHQTNFDYSQGHLLYTDEELSSALLSPTARKCYLSVADSLSDFLIKINSDESIHLLIAPDFDIYELSDQERIYDDIVANLRKERRSFDVPIKQTANVQPISPFGFNPEAASSKRQEEPSDNK